MTRAEYDARLAVKIENTEGFTQKQINWINDYIFEKVSEEDADGDYIRDYTQSLFTEAELALEAHEDRQGRWA